jgi:UDP-N-acetylmuramate dehydrogenase
MLRRRQLPDPALVPNAGSFFKNPLLPAEYAAELQRRYPDMPCFPHESGLVKIPAGWLLERCGWKGKWLGNVGTWKDHALVIVTDGTATGQQIVAFARRLWASVLERFGIALEPEVLVFPPQAWQSQLSSSGESDVPTAERNATVL